MRLYGWPVFKLLNFLSLIEDALQPFPDLRMKHACPRSLLPAMR
jgi:hypothetical protein